MRERKPRPLFGNAHVVQKVKATSLMRFSGLNQFLNMDRFTQVMGGSPEENRILVERHVWKCARNALYQS